LTYLPESGTLQELFPPPKGAVRPKGAPVGPDRSVAAWQVYHNRQVAIMVDRVASIQADLWDLKRRVETLEAKSVSRETDELQTPLFDLGQL